MSSYVIEDLHIGMKASHEKTVLEDDMTAFAKIPDEDCIHFTQTLGFLAPVHIGDTVKCRAVLACFCEGAGKRVVEGEETVFVPSRA